MTRVPGLSTLIKGLITVCKVIDIFAPSVRNFVPEGSLTAYDNALTAIKASCDVIRAINFADDITGTTPLWGTKG